MKITGLAASLDDLLSDDCDLFPPSANSAIHRLGKPPKELRRNPGGSRTTAKERLKFTIATMEGKTEQAVSRWRMTRQEELAWVAMRGGGRRPQNIYGSNGRVRYLIGCAFIDLMITMQDEHPGRRFFHVTIIHSGWQIYDRSTHIDLVDIQRRGYQVLKLVGLPCYAVIEIQAAVNAEAGVGRALLPHIHGIAWTDDVEFDPGAAEAKGNRSRRLRSFKGLPPVKVTEIDATEGDLAYSAQYLFKAPFQAKDAAPPSKRYPMVGFSPGLRLCGQIFCFVLRKRFRISISTSCC